MADTSTKVCFAFPLLEDANSVQLGLMRVIQWLGSGQIEPRIAGLMLYALQTASYNLKNVNFEAAKPTDVVIDRSTMDQTCINGPQWFASDFKLEEEQQGTSDAIADSAGQASPTEASPVEPRRESRQVRRARARAAMRKRPARAEIEETPSIARDFLYKIFPNGIPPVQARVSQG